jgi:hypothetical protein
MRVGAYTQHKRHNSKISRNSRNLSLDLKQVTEPTQEDQNLVDEVNKQISDLTKTPLITPTLSNWRDEHSEIPQLKAGEDIITK